MLAKLPDFCGLLGVICILLTYFFLQTGRMQSDSLSYLYLNLLGAILIIISLIFHWNLSSFVIEIFWMLISIMGLYRRYTKNHPS